MYFIRNKDFIYLPLQNYKALKNNQQFYFNPKQRHKGMNKLLWDQSDETVFI